MKNATSKVGLAVVIGSVLIALILLAVLIKSSVDDSRNTTRLRADGTPQTVTIEYDRAEVVAVGYTGATAPVTVIDPTGKPVQVKGEDSSRTIDGKPSRVIASFKAPTKGVYRISARAFPASEIEVSPDDSDTVGVSFFGAGTMCCILLPVGVVAIVLGRRQQKRAEAPPFSAPF